MESGFFFFFSHEGNKLFLSDHKLKVLTAHISAFECESIHTNDTKSARISFFFEIHFGDKRTTVNDPDVDQ